jgi:hypothetical protein
MLGAYYESVYNMPISGLGTTDVSEPQTEKRFAEQVLENILSGVEAVPGMVDAVAPLGLYTGWGMQTGDVSWEGIQPDTNLVVFPLSDALIKLAKQMAFGHEVGWVAIMTPRPVTLTAAEEAYRGRPYELFAGEVVYDQADAAEVPRPQYLYWGQLRGDASDRDGGSGSLEAAAKHLGGRLVFPVSVPRTGRERPRPALDVATVVASHAATSPSAPLVVQPTTATGPAAAEAGWPWWVWALGATAVGYGIYRVVR